jgi:hypothetical protein
MRGIALLSIHALATILKLIGPGGARSVVAESLLLKHQLLILNRSRQRAPNRKLSDRVIAGLLIGIIHPARLFRSAVVLKPSTLMSFHRSLVCRKYQWLFTPNTKKKPGPKGSSAELVEALVEMKRRNPRFGCRRIFGFAVHARALDGATICRMLGQAVSGIEEFPTALSTDHDPLFEFNRWKANLRVLVVRKIKSVPYAPMSHPFI